MLWLKISFQNSNVEMVTNGDPLNLKRLNKLFESGLNRILISAYDGKEDADKLEDLCKNSGLSSEQYIVRHRYYTEEQDFGITLSNRSGLMENAEFKIESLKEPLKKPLLYSFLYIFFRLSGGCFNVSSRLGKKNYIGKFK